MMKKFFKLFFYIVIAFGAGLLGALVVNKFQKPQHTNFNAPLNQEQNPQPSFASTARVLDQSTPVNFVAAARQSTSSVVFVKTISVVSAYQGTWLDWFFGGSGGSRPAVSTGSGVIYSSDGFIITNNHVIGDAEQIKIIHNKKEYDATVIGKDPSTDIAVLKVDQNGLPAIKIGSSRNLKIGEWVLAVGNPFNLTSTITAGIVSAKERAIGILESQFPIESFIQTDAAINPGNSGGALVNQSGELVGINTAILSKTGSYAGYGFAVPIDIAKKVADDLIQYGEVQKAFFGADVVEITDENASEYDAKELNGVAISYVLKEGAAAKKGLEKGDIIEKINGEPITSKSVFDEMMSYFSPGDKILVNFSRSGAAKEAELTLTNSEGTTSIVRRELYKAEKLGADFEAVTKVEKDRLGIEHGVRISKVRNGFVRRLGIEEGFIVTSINTVPITDPEELAEILENIRGRVVIQGINKFGVSGYYSFYF